MEIEIKEEPIMTITSIVIDGKKYPRTARNIDLASDYLRTKDQKFLEKLSDIVLDF